MRLNPAEESYAQREDPNLALFVVVLVSLSAPFWLVGAVWPIWLAPGLPLAGLAAFAPGMAGSLCGARDGAGVRTLREMLRRTLWIGRSRWWLVFSAVAPLIIAILSWGWLALTDGPMPGPRMSVWLVIGLIAVSVVAAFGEELAWTGYLLTSVRRRFGGIGAGALLGVIWALWHVPALLEAQRSFAWIAWWCAGTIASRSVIVSLCERSGGGLTAVTYHAFSNVAWQCFPVRGSHFDPAVHACMSAAAAALLIWTTRSDAPSIKPSSR